MKTDAKSAGKKRVATPKQQRTVFRKIAKKKNAVGCIRDIFGIKRGITLGRRYRPSQIVVVLHGLDDCAAACAKCVAKPWVKGLPEALIVVPESPDKTGWNKTAGYDWVPTKRPPPWDAHDEHGPDSPHYRASVKEYQRVLRARCRGLNRWLDALLMKHGLTNDELVLVGFSLGAYLSAIVGAKRNVLGVIVAGGMCTTREVQFTDLMPKKSRAQFCAVNGTKDELVKRSALKAALKAFKCEYHWSRGVGHDFPNEWYTTELKWMQTLFRSRMRH